VTNTENETRRHIHRVQELMYRLMNLLMKRCEAHDKSKLSEPEKSGFEAMDNEPYYPYGSPEYFDKLKRYSDILNHHYKLNPHHPEHYSGFISEMDLLDILEMVCDWASRRGGLSDKEMIDLVEQQSERFSIPSELSSILLNTMQRYLVAEEDDAVLEAIPEKNETHEEKKAPDQPESAPVFSSIFSKKAIDLDALKDFV